MANENRYFKTPFAESGDRLEVPDASVGGAVGFDTGFGPDYELPQGSVNKKRIERDKYNGLHHSITKNLKQWQEHLCPTWIEDAGTGTPFSYPVGMIVNHAGKNWVSNDATNTEEPGVGVKWSVHFDDWMAFTAALYADAGITDNGLPDTETESQRLDALKAAFDVYGTTADLAAGKFQVGKRVAVTDRANEPFKVTQGGTPNGYGTVDAGNGGNTAVLISLSGNSLAFGISATNTKAQNKAVIQAAIEFQHTNGVGFLSIPSGINYGYNRNDPSTFPDLTASTIPFIVSDLSTGDTYTLPSRDGGQVRTFMFTPNETDSLHDGNTVWQRGAWAPVYALMNDAQLAPVGDPSRAAGDNRRATMFFGNDGVVNWGVGQGNNSSATLTDDELSAFKVISNGLPALGVVGLTAVVSILKTNGNMGINNPAPAVPWDFNTRAGQVSATRFDCTSSGGSGRHVTTTEYGSSEYQVRQNDVSITYDGATIFRVHKLGNVRATRGINGGAFTTASRPNGGDIEAGTQIFDTTLGIPLWKKTTGSTAWINSNGTVV